MFSRLLVIFLFLAPVGSVMGPEEYPPVVSPTVEGDRDIVFGVYNGNYGWVRFNLTLVNTLDEMLFENHTWGYFNARVYDLNGSYLGDVRPGDDELYLLFMPPGGRHVRTWRWDKKVYVDNKGTILIGGQVHDCWGI